MNDYIAVLKKYVVFKGRSGRKEFWMFVLISLIISTVLGYIDKLISSSGSTILSSIYSLAILLPAIGVSIRRLHDTDRSGWWLLIGLIPFIGWIVLIVFYVMGSSAGQNKYGPALSAKVAQPKVSSVK